MSNKEVINQLESLKAHCESMRESGEEWEKDVRALEYAIRELERTAQEVPVQEQYVINFNPTTGEKINDNCNYCWVMKKENYNCGHDKCPGYKLLIKNITRQG